MNNIGSKIPENQPQFRNSTKLPTGRNLSETAILEMIKGKLDVFTEKLQTLSESEQSKIERQLQEHKSKLEPQPDKPNQPFNKSDARNLNLLWNEHFGSIEELFSKDDLSKLPYNKEIAIKFQNLVNQIQRDTQDTSNLTKPIGYAYDPDAVSGKASKGLVSFELTEQDREFSDGNQKLSDKLPDGKSIRIPKGFEITKICGGGSGSVNIIIYNKKTNKRFFMKYFHSTDATLKGHNWKQQFKETEAILNQQAGNIPLLNHPDLQGKVNIEKAAELSKRYRMPVYQLGVVVEFPNPNKGLAEEESPNSTDHESIESNRSQYESDDDSSDESIQSLASERGIEHNLKTSINRMNRSMENSSVEATFALSQVADGAKDLCDVISDPNANMEELVDVSKSYLEDMTDFQLNIASMDLTEDKYQQNDYDQFVGKMTTRFEQLNNVLSDLKTVSLKDALKEPVSETDSETGLETIGAMVDKPSFRFNSKQYPNPRHFLPELFLEFPKLFCSKKAVTCVHGDGQGSNLMYDSSKSQLYQVDVRNTPNLVSPHGEAAKLVVFGPKFTGGILNQKCDVVFDQSGLKLIGHPESNLERHQEYKEKLLNTLADTVKKYNFVPHVIHGHTHRKNIHEHVIGDFNFHRYVLGDWSDLSGNYLLWEKNKGFKFCDFN
ncbi:MAG: hypothetical protein VW397_01360 [Candidatus Margulisiibacteriota bacterium]